MMRIKKLSYVLLILVCSVFVVAFYYTNSNSPKPSEENVSPNPLPTKMGSDSLKR